MTLNSENQALLDAYANLLAAQQRFDELGGVIPQKPQEAINPLFSTRSKQEIGENIPVESNSTRVKGKVLQGTGAYIHNAFPEAYEEGYRFMGGYVSQHGKHTVFLEKR